MAPIALKVSSGSNMFNDLSSGNMDELPDTWRIYTNAKQALEHGSRLENRSWRRWFLSVQKNTKHQPPVASLEIQYKRNLLIQQRKQFQQFLTEVTMSLPTFDDEQYQPTNDFTHTSNTTATNSKDDNRSICFSEKSIHLPTTVASHSAMYVATDEPNSLVAAQHNTLQYRLQPPHPPSIVHYPTIIRESTSPTTNKKPKTQKHRFRRPLPVVNADGNDKTVCNDCGTFFTPLWRRYQNKTLCNACGLYWKLHNSPRPGHLIPSMTQRQDPRNSNNTLHDDQNELPHCSNCGTNQTTLWRRSELDGAPLCNACGLYAKLHQETRPLSMKTNVIKKRQRLY